MSPYYIELNRPGEDGLSIPMEDYHAVAKTARTCNVRALPVYPDEGGDAVTADQGRAIADAIGNKLPASWPAEIIGEFLSFLRRGAFSVAKVAY